MTTIARRTLGATGLTQVVLGLLFWTNHAFGLVPLHMAIGLAFVLSLWTLAALGARARVGGLLPPLGALWGAAVLALGVLQGRLLPGPWHWIVETLHLLLGLGAMALGARITSRIRRTGLARPAAAAPGAELSGVAAD